MMKPMVCALALLFSTLVLGSPSASAAEGLSAGCTAANNSIFDGTYASGNIPGFFDPAPEWGEGEILHVRAVSGSGAGVPITLMLDGVVVATSSSGDIQYTFPATVVAASEWKTDSGGSATWTVSCQDPPPDCSAVASSLSSVKADGKLHQVTLSGATDPYGQAVTLEVTGVTQDEPTTGGWRRDETTPDAAGVSGATVSVRGERNPSLNGRVYRIHYTATDSAGSTCSGYATVGVPVKKTAAFDDGNQASWNSFTGALV